jgi:hypothetical protein
VDFKKLWLESGPILKYVRNYKHHKLHTGCKEFFSSKMISGLFPTGPGPGPGPSILRVGL